MTHAVCLAPLLHGAVPCERVSTPLHNAAQHSRTRTLAYNDGQLVHPVLHISCDSASTLSLATDAVEASAWHNDSHHRRGHESGRTAPETSSAVSI